MSRSSWLTQSPPGGRGVRQSHRGKRAAASPKKKGMPSEGREGQGWRGQELARTLHAGAMWGHRVCRDGTHVGTHGHAWTQGHTDTWTQTQHVQEEAVQTQQHWAHGEGCTHGHTDTDV